MSKQTKAERERWAQRLHLSGRDKREIRALTKLHHSTVNAAIRRAEEQRSASESDDDLARDLARWQFILDDLHEQIARPDANPAFTVGDLAKAQKAKLDILEMRHKLKGLAPDDGSGTRVIYVPTAPIEHGDPPTAGGGGVDGDGDGEGPADDADQ